MTGFPTCPVCGGFIPDNRTPGAYPGALSRRDNLTEICSACGYTEALQDMATVQRLATTGRTHPNLKGD